MIGVGVVGLDVGQSGNAGGESFGGDGDCHCEIACCFSTGGRVGIGQREDGRGRSCGCIEGWGGD